MGRGKVVNLVLDSYGSFLGMEKGCIILRDKKGNTERYPLFESEIGEVVLNSGNLVSTGVLTSLGFWDISVVLTTRNGRPIATLKNLLDDSHVKIRICQYEALKNGKGIEIGFCPSGSVRRSKRHKDPRARNHGDGPPRARRA